MQQKIMLLQKRSYLCPWLLESALGSVIPHKTLIYIYIYIYIFFFFCLGALATRQSINIIYNTDFGLVTKTLPDIEVYVKYIQRNL